MENKFVKFTWAFNSIALFIAIILAIVVGILILIIEIQSRRTHETGIIVGKKADKAQELKIDLQQLSLSRPQNIRGTDIYYVEVCVVDKNLPRDVENAIKSANDFDYNMVGAKVNMIFFNSNRTFTNRLLPENGFIESFESERYNNDGRVTNDFILYNIISKDTNQDGRINKNDLGRIYMSDLNGSNLKPISPDSLNIDSYWVAPDGKNIFFEEILVHKDKPLAVTGYFETDRIYYYYNTDNKIFSRFDALDKEFNQIQEKYRAKDNK